MFKTKFTVALVVRFWARRQCCKTVQFAGKVKRLQEALVDLGQKTGPLFISHPTASPLTHIHNHIFILHSLSSLIQSLL